EDNLREQTQLLDGRKDASPQHTDDARKLAGQQEELRGSINSLREKTKFDDVKPLLGKVAGLMDEVAGELRQPRTDAEVIATQGAIIELLVPPDQKGGQGSMAKMQAMMARMMAQTQSRAAGGNNSKSSSAFAGNEAEGAAGKDKTNARSVEKSGGASSAGEWPEEFRDQLQAYFQQVESAGR
nr:hypothetical protein [Verrucomicrobiota bacterium]